LLVVNGPRANEPLARDIRQSAVETLCQANANLPEALYRGRVAVATDYFAFLDDDDVYLPGALALRLALLESSGADVVVSNGIKANGDVLIQDVTNVAADPLGALLVTNWLTSCGGLYRTHAVPSAYFAKLNKFLEWTRLAFDILVAGQRVAFLDTPTFQLFETAGSASKSPGVESLRSAIAIAEYMRARIPRSYRRLVARKLADAYHSASVHYSEHGEHIEAIRTHTASILHGGLRYCSYTRHMLSRICASNYARLFAPRL
jgi:glycosyltransferase involved in cell wall biosynthesis